MAIINPPAYMQNGEYTARDDRLVLRSLVQHHGIVSGLIVTQTPTASQGVRISTGRAFVQAQGTLQGSYHVVNDSVVDLPLDPAHSTYSRIDKVILRIRDAAISGSSNEGTLEVITGTAASTPAVPSTPVSSIVLATVTVPAKSTTVINSRINITNVSDIARVTYSLAPPSIRTTSTTRPTQDLTDCMMIFESNTGISRIREGSFWKYFTGDINSGGALNNIIQSERSGWDIVSGYALVRAGVLQVYVTFVRTSSTVINVPSNGNINNQEICTLKPEYRPAIAAAATSVASGRTAGGYCNSAGTLVLANVAPGTNITKDQSFSLGFTGTIASSVYSVT